MKKEEIIKKAISKAVKNGLDIIDFSKWFGEIDNLAVDLISHDKVNTLIFSHDFAKAFWGEEYPKEMKINGNFPYWEMELTQMVLEKEPLQYLKKFLDD